MKRIKQIIRLSQINFILARNGLDQVIVSIRLFAPLRFIIYLNPWNWFRREPLTHGQALRKTFEDLGPIFVKFGQALSTRPDILPPEIAIELSKLQDCVPPFDREKVLTILEKTFKCSPFDVFDQFNPEALASASIAQVHAARLKSGEEVVVKILRPNLRKAIERDLSILQTIASLAERYWHDSRRFKPKEIVQEFRQSLFDELDLHREAANAAQLRRNFHHSELLYVPEVHWDYVHTNVLVMERIYGIPVTDIARLRHAGVNLKKLAERGLEIFFTQVFRDCFFHADMHPGNIFVSLDRPDDPQYICVDFGIMGTLDDNDKRYLAENLLAFFNRDYKRVAQLHVESGWVARTTRIAEFESAVRTVCEPVFEKPLKDISFALLILRLFQVARRFAMEVQPQLILLQKTLLAVEGLGRQIYPELDLWTTAKPFLEKWLREQIGPKTLLKNLRNNLPFLIEQLPYMPRLLNDVLLLQKQYAIQMAKKPVFLKERDRKNTFWRRGFGFGILIATLLLSGLSYLNWLNHQDLAWLAMSMAGIGGLMMLIKSPQEK